jgi:hypothetical protein
LQHAALRLQHILRPVADATSERNDRGGRAEIRCAPTIDVAAQWDAIDVLAKRRSDLDTTMQAATWANELPERGAEGPITSRPAANSGRQLQKVRTARPRAVGRAGSLPLVHP